MGDAWHDLQGGVSLGVEGVIGLECVRLCFVTSAWGVVGEHGVKDGARALNMGAGIEEVGEKQGAKGEKCGGSGVERGNLGLLDCGAGLGECILVEERGYIVVYLVLSCERRGGIRTLDSHKGRSNFAYNEDAMRLRLAFADCEMGAVLIAEVVAVRMLWGIGFGPLAWVGHAGEK